MGRGRSNGLRALVKEEEKWLGRKAIGAYGRAFSRKYPNRNLSERVGPNLGPNQK